jgi:uncharacterized protein
VTPTASIFRGVDRAIFAASFAQRLRSVGVDVGVSAIERCSAALEAVGALTLSDLYWLLRISCIDDPHDLESFDRVFGALFDTEMGRLPTERRGQQRRTSESPDDRLVPLRRALNDAPSQVAALPWTTLPSVSTDESTDDDDDGDDGDDAVIPELRPSPTNADMDRPFELLDEAELDRIGRQLESAMDTLPKRRTRRRRPARSGGAVDMRRSMRRAVRTGGDVMTLYRGAPQHRPRRVVIILDVSGSMESYARAYLHLTRPLAHRHQAEVFAFATTITRITPSLRLRSPAEAIDHVTAAVGDRFTGTRLATSLGLLLHHRSWNTMLRGAVVVICSDGWDSDPPEQLDRTMRRLALIAHRVVWINPRAAAREFEPRAAGMAAALPHCDAFLPGNSATAIADVIAAMTV